jgi:hypothetical protein
MCSAAAECRRRYGRQGQCAWMIGRDCGLSMNCDFSRQPGACASNSVYERVGNFVSECSPHGWCLLARPRLQDGSTALIDTAFYGHADCARLLLNAGADKDIVNNVRGRSEASNDVLFCLRLVCQSQVRMLGNVIFFFFQSFVCILSCSSHQM